MTKKLPFLLYFYSKLRNL